MDMWRKVHLAAVVCRHHYQGIQSKESVLRATEYRQMAGRAGRAGIDTQGEAILLANNPQLGKQLLELMQVHIFLYTESCTNLNIHLGLGFKTWDLVYMYIFVPDCYSQCICTCMCMRLCMCTCMCMCMCVFICICTCIWDIMLEGLDFPTTLTTWCDMNTFCMLLCRPTQSPSRAV